MSKYVYKPYDSIFPTLFENEKNRLKTFLTGEYRIEHIGSTAVPTLGGKGIIDIYIVAAKKDLERISKELVNAGYELRPRVSEDQHVFHKIILPDPIEGQRTYHIHLNTPDSQDFLDTIKFRDYLRNHPENIKHYADAKQKAVNEAGEDKNKYMALKSPAIQEILKKA